MLPDSSGKRVQIHARAGMCWNFDRFHPERFNDLKDGKVSWTLDSDDVARACHRTHREIQRLHTAAGNRQVIWRKAAAVCDRAPRNLPSKWLKTIGELVAAAV